MAIKGSAMWNLIYNPAENGAPLIPVSVTEHDRLQTTACSLSLAAFSNRCLCCSATGTSHRLPRTTTGRCAPLTHLPPHYVQLTPCHHLYAATVRHLRLGQHLWIDAGRARQQVLGLHQPDSGHQVSAATVGLAVAHSDGRPLLRTGPRPRRDSCRISLRAAASPWTAPSRPSAPRPCTTSTRSTRTSGSSSFCSTISSTGRTGKPHNAGICVACFRECQQ